MKLRDWIKSHITDFPEEHLYKIITAGLGWRFQDVVLRQDEEISEINGWAKVEAIFQKRKTGQPLQYLTGEQAFWKDTFKVGPGVLIPRPETEHLIETALHILPRENVLVAELGVGSGNVGISLLKERPDWKWKGFEINPESLPYAQANLTALLSNPHPHYELIAGDFFIEAKKQAPYTAIIANPPYGADEEMATLQIEVQKEPALAINGGKKGLEIPRKLIEEGYDLLASEGWLMMEIGIHQAETLMKDMENRGYMAVKALPDLAGIERILIGQKGG